MATLSCLGCLVVLGGLTFAGAAAVTWFAGLYEPTDPELVYVPPAQLQELDTGNEIADPPVVIERR